MSQPRFLADEDFNGITIRTTKRLEPTIEFATARECGLSARSDNEILDYADANGWIVVSQDVSTMSAAAWTRVQSGVGMSGLLLVPQNRLLLPVVDSLIFIWTCTELEDWRDRVEYLPL